MPARGILFFLGIAGLAALTVYAGAGAVFHTLASLKIWGLALIAVLHVPVLMLLGLAWWVVGRRLPGASLRKLIWARFVRDAVAEVLPFSQAGGYLLGLRVLHVEGVRALPAALSMSVDLVMELWAKLPYITAGLAALVVMVPESALLRPLAAALALTLALASIPVLLRGRLWRLLESFALLLAKRWPQIGTVSANDVQQTFERMFYHRGRLFAGFGIHAFCWFAGAVETWIVLALMGSRVSPATALAVDSLVSALRTFAFLVPAAAGIQEGSYVLVCALFGISPAMALAISFARRARELVIGVPVIAVWQFTEARRLAPNA
jgi:glycosyltransferase 2 family protein